MKNVFELATSRQESSAGGNHVLDLDPSIDMQDAADTAITVFAQQPDVVQLALVVDGKRIGFIARSDVLQLLKSPDTRSDADHGRLNGNPKAAVLHVWHLICPVPDCSDRNVWTLAYDEQDPPRCGRHREEILRVVP